MSGAANANRELLVIIGARGGEKVCLSRMGVQGPKKPWPLNSTIPQVGKKGAGMIRENASVWGKKRGGGK